MGAQSRGNGDTEVAVVGVGQLLMGGSWIRYTTCQALRGGLDMPCLSSSALSCKLKPWGLSTSNEVRQ